MSAPRALARGLTLWPASAPDRPLMAVLSYTSDDPFAVRLAFVRPDGSETVDYLFARGMLADALLPGAETVGEEAGDIRIRQGDLPDWLVLELPGPSAAEPFELLASRDQLENITEAMYALVPMTCERDLVDVDALVADLLGVA